MASPCTPISLVNISPDCWQKLKDKAKEAGFAILDDHGLIYGPHGVELTYNYDLATQVLTLQHMNPGMFIHCGTVYDKLKELITQIG